MMSEYYVLDITIELNILAASIIIITVSIIFFIASMGMHLISFTYTRSKYFKNHLSVVIVNILISQNILTASIFYSCRKYKMYELLKQINSRYKLFLVLIHITYLN